MSLIKCPECGKEISDLSESCSYCGYPIKSLKRSNKNKKITKICLIIFVIIITLSAYTFKKYKEYTAEVYISQSIFESSMSMMPIIIYLGGYQSIVADKMYLSKNIIKERINLFNNTMKEPRDKIEQLYDSIYRKDLYVLDLEMFTPHIDIFKEYHENYKKIYLLTRKNTDIHKNFKENTVEFIEKNNILRKKLEEKITFKGESFSIWLLNQYKSLLGIKEKEI